MSMEDRIQQLQFSIDSQQQETVRINTSLVSLVVHLGELAAQMERLNDNIEKLKISIIHPSNNVTTKERPKWATRTRQLFR